MRAAITAAGGNLICYLRNYQPFTVSRARGAPASLDGRRARIRHSTVSFRANSIGRNRMRLRPCSRRPVSSGVQVQPNPEASACNLGVERFSPQRPSPNSEPGRSGEEEDEAVQQQQQQKTVL